MGLDKGLFLIQHLAFSQTSDYSSIRCNNRVFNNFFVNLDMSACEENTLEMTICWVALFLV